MVKVTKEVLDKCKKALIKHSAEWNYGVCEGLVGDILTGSTRDGGNTACHAWVSNAFRAIKENRYGGWSKPYSEGAKPFLILDCHTQPGRTTISCTRKAADFLILWMARESPFSEYVLNRDDEESLLKGGVILLCGPGGLTHAETVWICKVLRFKTEGLKAADNFMELVKGGVDGMLAIYVASLVRTKSGATFGYTGPEGHSTVIDLGTSVAGFVTRKLNKNASCTAEVFGYGRSGSFTKVKDFCKSIRKPDGWGGTTTGEGATDLVERVLEWQEKEFGDLLKPASVSKSLDSSKSPTGSTVYLEVDM